jgi:hypothetical protein
MKLSEGLQKLLSFGYLFLIVMGVLKESIFYYQIGINILKYSTITDILISPIADLVSHPIVFISSIVLFGLSYAFPVFLSKRIHKKWVQRSSGLTSKEKLSEEEVGKHFTNMFVKILALTLLSFFVGMGIGTGIALSKRIKNDTLKYNHKLTFSSGESEQIYMIGANSIYYFYLTKGNKNVKIAPVGAIKNMELINNKMLK